MSLTPQALSILTFVAAVLGVAGCYSLLSDLFFRDRRKVGERVDEEFHQKQRAKAEKSVLFGNLTQLVADISADSDDKKPTFRESLATSLEQAGMDLTPNAFLGVCAGAGVAGALGACILWLNPLPAAGGLVLGTILPYAFLRYKRAARLEKLRTQLPEAFDLMGRVVRAGQTIHQAMQAVSDEFPPPIAVELSYCYEQQNLGLAPEISFRELARRTGLLEMRIFVVALLVQQQTGGNLAEMLDKLSGIIRDRFRIRGQITSLTAEGRMQAMVLLGLPPIMFVLMFVMNRAYALTLLEHPKLIFGTIVCEVLGAIWIRKIVNFDF